MQQFFEQDSIAKKKKSIMDALSQDSHFKTQEVRAEENHFNLYVLGNGAYVIKVIDYVYSPIKHELVGKDAKQINTFSFERVTDENGVHLELEGNDKTSLWKYLDDTTITEINKHIKDRTPHRPPVMNMDGPTF